MNELLLELKKDLSKEKLQILDIVLAQLALYEIQLKKSRESNHYHEQLKLIEEMDKAA